MGDEFYGPPLPPAMTGGDHDEDNTEISSKTTAEKRKRTHSSSSDSSDSSSDSSSNSSSSESESDARKCRKLTSKRVAVKKSPTPHERFSTVERPAVDATAGSFIGPVVPVEFLKSKAEHEDNEDLPDWGPQLPEDGNSELNNTVAEIERRAQRMRNKLMNLDNEGTADVKPERESWMMELPPEHGKNFGLTARKFSMAAPSGNKDRSVWTDTPADRAKKEQDFLAGKLPAQTSSQEASQPSQRDIVYSHQVEEYNRAQKRDKSLLDLHNEKKSGEHKKKKKKERKHEKEKHQDKKKKKKSKEKEKDDEKKKKKEKIPERRPFDRDADLKVSRLDAGQKQAIIKRSQELGGRFGHGKTTSKFL